MKTILGMMFAALIGLTFVGSTFADEPKKTEAPAAAPGGAAEVKKEEKSKGKREKTKGHKKDDKAKTEKHDEGTH